jgi:hypothetical protein
VAQSRTPSFQTTIDSLREVGTQYLTWNNKIFAVPLMAPYAWMDKLLQALEKEEKEHASAVSDA